MIYSTLLYYFACNSRYKRIIYYGQSRGKSDQLKNRENNNDHYNNIIIDDLFQLLK